MKILGINGSPRKGGITDAILKMAFEPLEAAGVETEIVRIGGGNIRACTASWEGNPRTLPMRGILDRRRPSLRRRPCLRPTPSRIMPQG